jgi:hypothetical protein
MPSASWRSEMRVDETRWMATIIELFTLAVVLAFALARSAS